MQFKLLTYLCLYSIISIFTSNDMKSFQRSKVNSYINPDKNKTITDSLESINNFYVFDSLLARTDTMKYFHLYCIGRDFAQLKPNLSFAIADSIIEHSKQDNYVRGIISGYNLLGILYSNSDDYVKAVANLKEAIRIGERNRNNNNKFIKDKYGCTLYYLGDLYFKRNEYKNALDYYIKSMNIFNSFSNTELLNEDYNYTLTSFAISTIREDRAYAIYGVGKTFIKLGNLEKARKYLNITNELAEQTLFEILKSRIYYSMSELDLASKDTISAIDNINKSLELSLSLNLNEFTIKNYLMLMEVYLAQENYTDIESIYSKLINLTNIMNMKEDKAKTHQLYSEYLYVIGKPKEAVQEVEKANRIRNEILDDNKSRRFGQLEEDIKYQRKIFDIELKSIKANEEEKRRTTQLYFSIALILLLIIVVIVIVFYIKKNKELNDELKIANSQLTELNETKTKLFRIVSHDLMNPIKEFDARITELKEDLDNGENSNIATNVGGLGESARSIYSLLNSLLDWAESQFKEIKIQKVNVNIEEAINRILLLYKANIKEKQLTIEQDLEITNLYTDPNIFQIIIRNIIHNSIKFTPAGGSIKISTYEEDGFNFLSIEDTGRGMSKEKIDAILSNTHYNINFDDIQTGSSLGLRAVKDYIDLLNGILSIESSPNKGTRVTIYFS